MLLSLVGVSIAGTAFLAGQRVWLTWFAAAMVAGGWVLLWRRRRACAIDASCPPPSRTLILLLGISTLLVALALLWPSLIEPWLLELIREARE